MTDLARSRALCALSLVVGAAVLGWSLTLEPGDVWFYPATLALALVWTCGAFAARAALRQPLAGLWRSGSVARDLRLGAGAGIVLLVVFLVGAFVLMLVPPLRDPVQRLLAHADQGSFPVVFALTMINGAAEELFFRGALFDACAGLRPLVVTTVIYTLVTAASGIWMLAFAGLVLGVIVAWLRRRTGAVLASTIAHLLWSGGMLVLLPHVLNLGS